MESLTLRGDYSYENSKTKLIILDYLTRESSGTAIFNLLSRVSYHKSLSVICINQNLFHEKETQTDPCLNMTYMIVFKNLCDRMQKLGYMRRPHVSPEIKIFTAGISRHQLGPYSSLFLYLSQKALK